VGLGDPTDSAVGDVHRTFLGALAAGRLVGGGLDVVGGAVGAGVGVGRRRGVLLELERAVRVLGGTDVRGVVRELAREAALERLALGLLEGGRPEVGAR
jgi:hypothetical protein